MKTISKLALIIVAASATVAFAKDDPKDPAVKARVEVMKTIGQNMKVLGDMAGQKAPFDPAAAATAKEAIIAAMAQIAPKFEAPATDPASEAKPEIWTNWTDFVAKSEAAKASAAAVDAGSLEALQTSVGAVGGACKTCHTAYRM